jgi:hypothetical protein
MMLKLFENFKRLNIKIEVTPEDSANFLHLYAVKTGKRIKENDNVVYRKPGPTAWGVAYRVYFEAEKWVADSLELLGHHIEPLKNNIYTCSREDLFWDLMEYGYSIGENDIISYEYATMKYSLKVANHKPIFNITNIESEDPITEAQMLIA